MRIVIAVVFAIAALAATGFAKYGDRPTPKYVTAHVERGNISTNVKATGVVNGVVMVDVGSELSGQISEVLANFNDNVKAGQVIARINPETYVAAVNEATATLKIAQATAQQQKAALQRAKVLAENARTARTVTEAELAAAQTKQEEYEREFQRNFRLSKSSAVSDREFTQARTSRDVGAASLLAMKAQLKM